MDLNGSGRIYVPPRKIGLPILGLAYRDLITKACFQKYKGDRMTDGRNKRQTD